MQPLERLRSEMIVHLTTYAQKKSPLAAIRAFERQVTIIRDAMHLTYQIPGARYWQPPGVCSPFATAPGELPHRADVVELTWHEFVSRYGDPDEL